MSQRQQLERIFEIDRQIRAGLYPRAEDIAAKLECSRRVIFEDKRFMVDRLGAPITFDRDKGGWAYTDPTWILPSIMVSEGELLAFLLSIEIAQRHLGTTLESSLRSAIEKISKSLKGPVRVELEQFRAYYSVAEPAAVATSERVLLDLYKAAQERRQVMNVKSAYGLMRFIGMKLPKSGERDTNDPPRNLMTPGLNGYGRLRLSQGQSPRISIAYLMAWKFYLNHW